MLTDLLAPIAHSELQRPHEAPIIDSATPAHGTGYLWLSGLQLPDEGVHEGSVTGGFQRSIGKCISVPDQLSCPSKCDAVKVKGTGTLICTEPLSPTNMHSDIKLQSL